MLFWQIFAASFGVIVATVLVGQGLAWLVERRH
jgi:ABC-type Fe3+ transport system permease subunit